MKKKIFSALLACVMLGQSVALAATNLKTYVNNDSVFTTSGYIVDEMFDYGAYRASPFVGEPEPRNIATPITTTVRVDGAGAFAAHTTSATALNSGSPTANLFDYKAELDMSEVRTAFMDLYTHFNNWIEFDGNLAGDIADSATPKGALWSQFRNSAVTGEFVVELTFDASLDVNPAETFTLVQSSDTFVENVGSRVLNDTSATFIYNIKSGLTVAQLMSEKDARLANLSMTFENVTAATQGTALSVDVSMTNAYIEVADNTIDSTYTSGEGEKFAKVYFASPEGDNSEAYVKVSSSAPSGPSGGSSVTEPKAYKVIDGEKYSVDVEKRVATFYVNIDGIETPVKEGYEFVGWYLDEEFKNPASGEISILKDIYIYAKFEEIQGYTPPSVDVVIDGEETPVETEENEEGETIVNVDAIEVPEKEDFAFDGWYEDPNFLTPVNGEVKVTEDLKLYPKYVNLKAPDTLISDSHIAYVYGYPDGEVKPNGNITREEVAAIFYRLLKPEYRATIETVEHPFPDVEEGRWSLEEIATLANGKFIVGDENGNFNPSKAITRAEFIAIATRFVEAEEAKTYAHFTDIAGHWAEDPIKRAASKYYWISGYEDGTFRPDGYITRAEAMTIVNKMLVRYGDVDAAHAKQWPDLEQNDWYYSNVIEATTHDHGYDRHENGWSEEWHPEVVE